MVVNSVGWVVFVDVENGGAPVEAVPVCRVCRDGELAKRDDWATVFGRDFGLETMTCSTCVGDAYGVELPWDWEV